MCFAGAKILKMFLIYSRFALPRVNSLYYLINLFRMSEILDDVSLERFKNRIKFHIEHCLKYVEKQCIYNSENKVIVTIHM